MSSKNQLSQLAIFRGTPAFSQKIHVGRPNVANKEQVLQRISNLLDRRQLTNNGPYVQELEQRIAVLLDVKHCIVVSNGTTGLEIAARAAGLKNQVIMPSMTFVATAHALQWQQITPVFCDVDPQTHNIDPTQVEALITPNTTGIIGVHLWGRPCHTDTLAKIATKHNLKLLYDAAHAFGCSHKGQMIGNFGDAEVFSFHATKFFNTFEGGAITTNNDKLAYKIRLQRDFGFLGYDNVKSIGINGKMNEVSAAMGLTQLECLDDLIDANYRNYKQYNRELKGIAGLKMVAYNKKEQNNYQYVVLEIDESITQITRDQIVNILHAENVLARRYFYPGCHRMEPYCSKFPPVKLPHTETLVQRVLSLPTGTSVIIKDISKICQIIRLAINHGGYLKNTLNIIDNQQRHTLLLPETRCLTNYPALQE